MNMIEFYVNDSPDKMTKTITARIEFTQDIVVNERELSQHRDVVQNLVIRCKNQILKQLENDIAKWAISHDLIMMVPRRG